MWPLVSHETLKYYIPTINTRIELNFCMLAQIQESLKKNFLGWLWPKMGITLSFLNEWMNQVDFLRANTYSRKLIVTIIVIGGTWSNMNVVFNITGL